MEHTEIKKAVIRSQHCQRNWDLNKEIPQEDLDLIVHAATQCPSKQNVAFYKVHFITNREVIEAVHDKTAGFTNYETGGSETNSQTLANLLIAFEEEDYIDRHTTDTVFRNDELLAHDKYERYEPKNDIYMSMGISASAASLAAVNLGYKTGFCKCIDSELAEQFVQKHFYKRVNNPTLALGIGHPLEGYDRSDGVVDGKVVYRAGSDGDKNISIFRRPHRSL